jgi:branched-chain amino acid transport system substrate-binding protein
MIQQDHFMRSINLLTICLVLALPFLFVQPVLASNYSEKETDTVKIGLLIPDVNSIAAKQGAELALKSNKNLANNLFFKLEVRTMEGPWGTGSKQAVDLIFDEKVVALLGSHDGRNAHLVEQVAAKARVIFVSAWSGDPTLSEAYVPWFYNCVPNDLQQADALIDEIYNLRKFSSVALVSDSGYDSKLAAASFIRRIKVAGLIEPLRIIFNDSRPDFSDIQTQLLKNKIKCLVFIGHPPSSLKFTGMLQKNKINLPVFVSLSFTGEHSFTKQELNDLENVTFISPACYSSQKGKAFIEEFMNQYGYQPGPVAAYAYDAMNIIIRAITDTGTDRESLQKYLSGIRYEGVTGIIQFDTRGNRTGKVHLAGIRNGQWVEVEK